jgi:hypothetical protein
VGGLAEKFPGEAGHGLACTSEGRGRTNRALRRHWTTSEGRASDVLTADGVEREKRRDIAVVGM